MNEENGKILTDEENSDVITLVTKNGEEIDFIEVAEIAYDGYLYVIAQPVELLPFMEDDEALVFRVTPGEDDENIFDIVLDDEIIDAVFAEYGRLYREAVGDPDGDK